MNAYEFKWIKDVFFFFFHFLMVELTQNTGLLRQNPTTSAGDWRDLGSVLGLGWSPGGGPSNPLQYSCLESSMDRGAWWLQSIGLHLAGHDWSDLAHTQDTNHYFFRTNIWKLKCSLNSNLEIYALVSLKSTFMYIHMYIFNELKLQLSKWRKKKKLFFSTFATKSW